MLVTALSPVIGYDKASAIAHKANDESTTLREAALATGYIDAADFDRIVNPAASRALADAFIGAVACPVLFQAQQAEEPAGIINDSQPASPFPQQGRGRGTERVRRPRGAADEFAEPDGERGTRCGCGKIRPLDRGDQPAVCCDDQGHVDVLVLEEGSDHL
jgi:Fumarase C C-terminus